MENEQTCPLCKLKNNCRANNPATACWCAMLSFPRELNDKIKKLPETCICSTCAQKLGAIQKSFYKGTNNRQLIHKNKE